MKEKYVKKFINKKINVGVPHRTQNDRLFYRTGTAKELTNNFLVLETNHSVKKIPLQNIQEIELNKEEN